MKLNRFRGLRNHYIHKIHSLKNKNQQISAFFVQFLPIRLTVNPSLAIQAPSKNFGCRTGNGFCTRNTKKFYSHLVVSTKQLIYDHKLG